MTAPGDPVLDSLADARQARDLGFVTHRRYVTVREVEILRLASVGLSNREIADRLHMSPETVKSHVRHLLFKLHAVSRAHVVAEALRHGLID